MTFAILIFVVFVFGFGAVYFFLGKRFSADDEQLKINLAVMKTEQKTKEDLLRELGKLSLGYITKEYFSELEEQLKAAEEELRAEKGRMTITEAELEAVDVRLRELEELKRELEMSSVDAIREVELLRAQERDIAAQNDALKNQLKSSHEQLDNLLEQLASNAGATEQLRGTKRELLESETKIEFYRDQIAILNQKYLGLKRAYDALDIEYAQLYEKQQAG